MSKTINSAKWPASIKPEVLKNELKKSGVKEEEMHWAHLDELIAKHQKAGTKITVPELKNWIATNDTKIYFRTLASHNQFNEFISPKISELERETIGVHDALVAAGQPPKAAMTMAMKLLPPADFMLAPQPQGLQAERRVPGYPRFMKGSLETGTYPYANTQTMPALLSKMKEIGYHETDPAVRSVAVGLKTDPKPGCLRGCRLRWSRKFNPQISLDLKVKDLGSNSSLYFANPVKLKLEVENLSPFFGAKPLVKLQILNQKGNIVYQKVFNEQLATLPPGQSLVLEDEFKFEAFSLASVGEISCRSCSV